MTSLQYLPELRRDWARSKNLCADARHAKKLGDAYDAASATPNPCERAGPLVGVINNLLDVRSPAPPLVALVGLLGFSLASTLSRLSNRSIATNDKAIARDGKRATGHSTIFAFIGNFTEKDRSTK